MAARTHLIATAGPGGHGKSALVAALGPACGPAPGGTEPGWCEGGPEPRLRGAPDCAVALPSGARLAMVDLPGDGPYTPSALARLGPIPTVLFAVAADQGWTPQSAEHLAVIEALGIRDGLLVATRCDLADPGPALAQARAAFGQTSLAGLESVAVSARTGAGLAGLIAALDRLVAGQPAADPGGLVRIWVDGSLPAADAGPGPVVTGPVVTGPVVTGPVVTGPVVTGPVVTGTLPAGSVHLGDELALAPAMRPVRVHAIWSLGGPAAAVTGPGRVALRLSGVSEDAVGRGMALVQPGRWTMTDVADVRITTGPAARSAGLLPRQVCLHVGSAAVVARLRPLGGQHVRLTLREPLPLHPGDRILLRDRGAAATLSAAAGIARLAAAAAGRGAAMRASGPAVLGAVVLDVIGPPLVRRGAAAAAARELAGWPDRPGAAHLLGRHGLLRASTLIAMGITDHPVPVTGEWLADAGYWSQLAARLGELVAARGARRLTGLPAEAARTALGLPDRRLVEALVRPPLRIRDGLITVTPAPAWAGPARPAPARPDVAQPEAPLPGAGAVALRMLQADLAAAPFRAPDAGRLRRLGIDAQSLAAAERAGLLLLVSDQVALAPGADTAAAAILAGLPQPFTAAAARQALATTRRVVIPLLEYLDRAGVTERLPDDRRRLCGPRQQGAKR